jgi:hypothetical protein
MEPSVPFNSEDSGRLSEASAALILPSHGGVLEAEAHHVEPTLEILAFALDSFIDALIDDTSHFHEFAHFINERPHLYDRLNSRAMELFDVLMLHAT